MTLRFTFFLNARRDYLDGTRSHPTALLLLLAAVCRLFADLSWHGREVVLLYLLPQRCARR